MKISLALLERDLLPDAAVRFGIRRLLRQRLADETAGGPGAVVRRKQALVDELRQSPIALHVGDANEQHYEVPTEFFRHVLGRHMKYSGGYWPDGLGALDGGAEFDGAALDASEEAMLELSAERAQLEDGQDVLELGCGWGSFTLFIASKFPQSRVVGVSNSRTQREYILSEAVRRGLGNVAVVTADMNDFDAQDHFPERRFDRVVSVEMLEHMRNYEELFRRIARWMKDDARFFVHIFCHREVAYPFTVRDASDWMAKFFFTGGLMPSFDLFRSFDEHLAIEEEWKVSGTHYEATSNAWLAKMDIHRDVLQPILERTYGAGEVTRWWVRWRTFFMACAELFGYRGGEEWLVGHYRFRKVS